MKIGDRFYWKHEGKIDYTVVYEVYSIREGKCGIKWINSDGKEEKIPGYNLEDLVKMPKYNKLAEILK